MLVLDRILAIEDLEPDHVQCGISGDNRAILRDNGFVRKDGIKAKDYMIRTIKKTEAAKAKGEKAIIKGDKKLGGESSIPSTVKDNGVTVRNPILWKDEDNLKWAVKHQATKMGLKVNDVQLADLKDKWGHTTVNTSRPNNSRETPAIPNVTLNKELLALPKKLGEFVIVHELAHTLAPNHSKLFKTFMSAYMPDWEDRETELQKYSNKKTQSAKLSKK